jgi:hypothetical protein
MKKSILFLLAICLLIGNPVNAQGGFLKKVTKSMTNELLGKPEEPDRGPEPACACDKPDLILDLGGKLNLDYREVSISVLNDGRILVQTRGTNQYYVLKDGVTQGPYKDDDPRVKEFEPTNDDKSIESFILKNKPYISKSGDKLLITFGGKTYGPYGAINSFVITKSKEKFAAIVVENPLVDEELGKKMDAAVKNAKTDQEKMDLAMQYAQDMQQKMMQGGGPASTQAKFVSNIPNATYDPIKTVGSALNGDVKYDDILMVAYNKILDLQGNTIMSIKPEAFGAEKLFVNTANTKYAYFNYGTLSFSDKTTLSELFVPHLVKEADGKIYLAYMYFSPKKNAIMQCKILF